MTYKTGQTIAIVTVINVVKFKVGVVEGSHQSSAMSFIRMVCTYTSGRYRSTVPKTALSHLITASRSLRHWQFLTVIVLKAVCGHLQIIHKTIFVTACPYFQANLNRTLHIADRYELSDNNYFCTIFTSTVCWYQDGGGAEISGM